MNASEKWAYTHYFWQILLAFGVGMLGGFAVLAIKAIATRRKKPQLDTIGFYGNPEHYSHRTHVHITVLDPATLDEVDAIFKEYG